MQNQNNIEPVEAHPIEPQETPETELAQITAEGDPEVILAVLEKKAKLAPRFKQARDTIIAAQTYPADWVSFGKEDKEMMCLKSAAAERISNMFEIRFEEPKEKKELFIDAAGPGYRYIYSGCASHNNRRVFAIGVFSSRDQLLGKVGGEPRPLEEINENHIINAACNIWRGNCIKVLFGLRSIPKVEWEKIMKLTGEHPSKAAKVRHGAGTEGGTTSDDRELQKELAETCIAIAAAGWFVEKYQGEWKLTQQNELQSASEPIDLAKMICVEISSFEGKDGAVVAGKPASQLHGKRLEISVGTARKLKEKMARLT